MVKVFNVDKFRGFLDQLRTVHRVLAHSMAGNKVFKVKNCGVYFRKESMSERVLHLDELQNRRVYKRQEREKKIAIRGL
jgi:hypothetical protein